VQILEVLDCRLLHPETYHARVDQTQKPLVRQLVDFRRGTSTPLHASFFECEVLLGIGGQAIDDIHHPGGRLTFVDPLFETVQHVEEAAVLCVDFVVAGCKFFAPLDGHESDSFFNWKVFPDSGE